VPYNSIVARQETVSTPSTGYGALVPEDFSREIFTGILNKSAALQLFPHRTMSRMQQRMPVLSALPSAYWVAGDTGLKQTTAVQWANKWLVAEELAVIVPIPEKLLDDIDYDLWDEIRPLLEESIAIALDEAVFFGIGKPASWPTAVVPAAIAAGNSVVRGASAVDVADDLNNVMTTVEVDGFAPNGWWMRPQFKASLRGLRDGNKDFLFLPEGPSNYGVANNNALAVSRSGNTGLRKADGGTRAGLVFGEPAYVSYAGLSGFTTATSGQATQVEAVTGDFSQGILGVRQDLTFKMLDQSVIQDNTGAIIYNLAQQDLVAMRVVCRYGFQVPNPISRMQPTEGARYPFAALLQPTPA
jgi:predicted phage gp36 major capsid-like protein